MKENQRPVDWINVSFLLGTPLFLVIVIATGHLDLTQVHWAIWAFALAYGFVVGLSITGGYHRLFSHRTYRASKIVRLFFLIFGAGAVQNSAIKWCSDHRRHHKCVDREDDPYNINKGFFWAHMGWIFFKDYKHLSLIHI